MQAINQNNIDKDQIIDQQYKLQQLLISISTEYINADLTDIDGLIDQSLKQMGEFVEADRSYIFSYDLVKMNCSNTYEWCAEGIEPEIQNLQEIPIEYIPQWLEAHEKGEAFYVQDVSLLPNDGEFGLKAILEPQGIKSLIAIPMKKEGQLIGFVGFDSVKKIFNYSENEKNILFVFANMLVNVRQRKENEEHIKEQKERKEKLLKSLESQNKELSDYAHAVSHDLKAPLRNINALINWIKEDNDDNFDDATKESLKLVLFNLEKMDNLIKGILEYSSIDKIETINTQLDLDNILSECLASVLIPNSFKIVVPNTLPKIYGNAYKIKQIFQNLIQNAVLYNTNAKPFIEVGFKENKADFEFYVKDNGKGIEEAYHTKIFNSFFKLHNDIDSSGLGLSIVKKSVESIGGRIWIESAKNQGATFYFTIPKV